MRGFTLERPDSDESNNLAVRGGSATNDRHRYHRFKQIYTFWNSNQGISNFSSSLMQTKSSF